MRSIMLKPSVQMSGGTAGRRTCYNSDNRLPDELAVANFTTYEI